VEDIVFELLEEYMINKFSAQYMFCELLTEKLFRKYPATDMYVEHHTWMPTAAGNFVGMDFSQEYQDSDVTSARCLCPWFQFRKPFNIMDLRL
jgi:hypothetical protein